LCLSFAEARKPKPEACFFPPQRIFVRLLPDSLSPARHYSCAGDSGRFSGI